MGGQQENNFSLFQHQNYRIAEVLSNQKISQKFMAAKWSDNCHEVFKIFEICQPDKLISKWILSIRFWSWKSFNWDCEKSLASEKRHHQHDLPFSCLRKTQPQPQSEIFLRKAASLQKLLLQRIWDKKNLRQKTGVSFSAC